MKIVTSAISALAVAAALCVPPDAEAAGYPHELDVEHSFGRPAAHGPVAVFPIYRKVRAKTMEYLTLDEATRKRAIRITEKEGGSVPEVRMHNRGKLPIYIAAGEVVLGGKQDRMVSHDVLIAPGAKMTVSVRCVEHGRWSGSNHEFRSAGAMGGNKTKLAVQFKGQSEVWQEVARQNADNSATSATGSFRASLDKGEIKRKLKAIARVVLPALEGRNAVGMIVAVNGEVFAIEMFGTPKLFSKMKRKLLDSFVLDALAIKDLGLPPPSASTIVDFYRSILVAQAEELKRYKDNKNMKRENRRGALNDSLDESGELIHRSLLAY